MPFEFGDLCLFDVAFRSMEIPVYPNWSNGASAAVNHPVVKHENAFLKRGIQCHEPPGKGRKFVFQILYDGLVVSGVERNGSHGSFRIPLPSSRNAHVGGCSGKIDFVIAVIVEIRGIHEMEEGGVRISPNVDSRTVRDMKNPFLSGIQRSKMHVSFAMADGYEIPFAIYFRRGKISDSVIGRGHVRLRPSVFCHEKNLSRSGILSGFSSGYQESPVPSRRILREEVFRNFREPVLFQIFASKHESLLKIFHGKSEDASGEASIKAVKCSNQKPLFSRPKSY